MGPNQPVNRWKLVRIVPILWILTMLVSSSLYSQNSDCNTAVPVCDATYTETDSPSGTGDIFEQAPGSCQTFGEFNSAWYVFTAQEDGLLGFILDPNDDNDDYDWSLFNITDNGCEGINDGSSPEVSCNSWGTFLPPNGPTGISTAMGGTGNSNGPGDLLGPPFNADLEVQAGNVYALVVMNFSATLNGYTLDFGESTAPIYDDIDPQVVSVEVNCDATELTLLFSENVITTGLSADQFALDFDGTTIIPQSAEAPGGNFSHEVTLTFTDPLGPGDYLLQDGPGEALQDFCNNPWAIEFPFEVNTSFTFGDPVIVHACNGTGGSIEFPDATGGVGELEIELNNSPEDDLLFTDLAPGNYIVTVTDETTCEFEQSVLVSNTVLSVDAGVDTILCTMSMQLQAIPSAGTFTWSANAYVEFADASDPATVVNANIPGEFPLFATVTLNNCEVTDAVNVTFNYPPQVSVVATPETCHEFCDGAVAVNNLHEGSISVTLDGTTLNGNEVVFEQLCAGEKELFVMFSPQCTGTYDCVVGSPDPPHASFEAHPWTTTVVNTAVELVNTSTHSDSVHWVISNPDMEFSDDTWNITLPLQIGIYPVVLTAFGENGCTDEFIGYLTIEDEFNFYIPNSFTPNEDHINDIFRPEFSYPPTHYEFSILDRWGEVIFYTTDHLQPWTGSIDSGQHFAPDGVYTWQLKVKGREIEVSTFTGSVTIVR